MANIDPIEIQTFMETVLNEAAGIKSAPKKKKKIVESKNLLTEKKSWSAAEIKRLIELNKGKKAGDAVISMDGSSVPNSVMIGDAGTSGFDFLIATKSKGSAWIRSVNAIVNEIDEVIVDLADLKKALSKV